jgi:hypothetical protein
VLFGHVAGGVSVVDQSVTKDLAVGSHTLLVTIKGASISLVIDGVFVASRAYNAALADGRFGLYADAGTARFDSLRVRTDGITSPIAAPLAAAQPAAPDPSADPTQPQPTTADQPAPTPPGPPGKRKK